MGRRRLILLELEDLRTPGLAPARRPRLT